MNYEAFAAATDKHLLNGEQEDEVTHIVRNSGAASAELLWEMVRKHVAKPMLFNAFLLNTIVRMQAQYLRLGHIRPHC